MGTAIKYDKWYCLPTRDQANERKKAARRSSQDGIRRAHRWRRALLHDGATVAGVASLGEADTRGTPWMTFSVAALPFNLPLGVL